MNGAEIAMQLRSLRAQMQILEAKLVQAAGDDSHTLAELGGLLRGQADTTQEQIDKIVYRCAGEDHP